MVAIGETYGLIGMKVAARTRSLPAAPGWCPLDPSLDHIPVTLFTDVPASALAQALQKDRPGAQVELARRAFFGSSVAGVSVVPEARLSAWDGEQRRDGVLLRHLGGWKVRWLHVQAMLQSPYTMTLYLDVDALPCSSRGIARLFQRVANRGAAIGCPIVVAQQKCQSTQGDCHTPHPEMLTEHGLAEWANFTERNAGVVVFDMRMAKPILQEFARTVKRKAGSISGDQYGLREALFKHRHIPQVLFGDTEVCRYSHEHTCDSGCHVEHECHMQSLVRAGVVPAGTFQSMGITD